MRGRERKTQDDERREAHVARKAARPGDQPLNGRLEVIADADADADGRERNVSQDRRSRTLKKKAHPLDLCESVACCPETQIEEEEGRQSGEGAG